MGECVTVAVLKNVATLPAMPTSIAGDSVVTIHYKLTLDDGSIADSSFDGEPLVYLHGYGNLVLGLERQLLGKKKGDQFDAAVLPAEGYGDYDPAAEHKYPRSSFPKNAELSVGMGFHTQDKKGNSVPLFVKELNGDEVVVTSNHPLAGQRLNFQIEVLDLRAATKQELQHGHVHGKGGHHH